MVNFLRQYLFASFVFAFTIGFFAPIHIYANNSQEFTFLLRPLLISIGVFSLLMLFGFMLVPFLLDVLFKALPFKHFHSLVQYRYVPYFFTVCALALWLQGNILSLNLGVMNNRPIPWEQYYIQIGVNVFVWMLIAVAFYAFRSRYRKVTMPICIILMSMQSANFISEFQNMPEAESSLLYTQDQTNQYRFSSKKNVVILLLDTFQADVFEEVLRVKPSFREHLVGFTYYNNNAGGFQATMPAIPLIMTGQYYDNQEPIKDFIRTAFTHDSIPKQLIDRGYDVAYECSPFMYCDKHITSSMKLKPTRNRLTAIEMRSVLKPVVVRYLPSVVYMLFQKTKVGVGEVVGVSFAPLDQTPDYYAADQALLNSIKNHSTIAGEQPVFRFYRFIAPHPPFYMNKTASYELQPHNRAGFVNHSGGALTMAVEVIEVLKNMNIYDQTMLIIMSDHGYGMGYKHAVSDLTEDQNEVISAALPLLLIKPFSSKTPFTINNEPLSHASFKNDLIEYLDASDSLTLFKPTKLTQRFFYHYDWQEEWPDGYLPKLTKYVVGEQVRSWNFWSKVELDR
jgi:hypothetical protein